jgi:hypothetical protein
VGYILGSLWQHSRKIDAVICHDMRGVLCMVRRKDVVIACCLLIIMLASTGCLSRGRMPISSDDSGKVILDNGIVRFEFDKETGVLASGWNMMTGEKYIDESPCTYEIEDKARITRGDETKDLTRNDPVVVFRNGYYEVVFECLNKGARDLKITKTYLLGSSDSKLIKRLKFASDVNDVAFIKVIDNVNVSSEFRKGSYYHTPFRNTGPPQNLPADEVIMRRQANTENIWYALEIKMTALVNLQKGYGVGTYRYKIDGEWVSHVLTKSNMQRLYYTPKGWSMGIFVDRLRSEGTSDVEIHYVIFEGDHIAFHQGYLENEEVAAIRNTTKVPEWVKDMRMAFGNWYSEREMLEVYLWRIENVLKSFPEGHIAIPAVRWNAVWGDYFTEGEMLGTYGNIPVEADWLAESLEMLHDMSPRIKYGLYTWRWTLGEDSKTYAEHPDWVVYKQSGEPDFMLNSDGRGAKGFTSNLKPEYAEYILAQYRAMFEKYDADLQYLDGEPRGINMINWRDNEVIQDSEWMKLLKGMYEVVREQGDDTAALYNSSGGFLSDMSYTELPGDLIGFLEKHGWQTLADRLLISKLRSPEDSVIVMLYWHDSHNRQYNEPVYSNYTIGLGLCPAWGVIISGSTYGNVALVDAAYEVRPMKLLVNTDLYPLWWKEDTDIEAHTLKQGNAYILSVINHGESGDTVVSVDTSKFGLEVGKTAYIWEFPRKHPFKDPGVNSMFGKLGDEVAKLRESGSIPLAMEQRFMGEVKLDARLEVELNMDEDLLTMVSVSHVPAVVRAVDGQRLNFYLPTTMGVNIDGGPVESGIYSLSVESDRKDAEILVYIPDGVSLSAVEVDGNAVDCQIEQMNGHKFAVVRVGSGSHHIFVR